MKPRDVEYTETRVIDGVAWTIMSSIPWVYHRDIDWAANRNTGHFCFAVRADDTLPAQVHLIYVPADAPREVTQ